MQADFDDLREIRENLVCAQKAARRGATRSARGLRKRAGSLPDVPDDGVTTLTDEQRAAARRTVAYQADRQGFKDELAEVLKMLGIFPNQEVDDYATPESFRTSWNI